MTQTDKKHILVVEDDPSLSKLITGTLEAEGYAVEAAMDGEAGLSAALSRHPDLILLDVALPKLDGISLLTKLRKDVWGADVPVVILTNLSDAGKAAEAMEEGVCDYLVKTDWKLADVVKKVRERLG